MLSLLIEGELSPFIYWFNPLTTYLDIIDELSSQVQRF